MRRSWVHIGIAACVLGTAIAGTSAATASPGDRGPGGVELGGDGEATDLQQIAAEQMVDDYGITIDDALDQLADQEAANRTATLLSRAVPPDLWAGSYIDHANSGRLVAHVAGRLPLPSIQVPESYQLRTVAWSLATLQHVKEHVESVKADEDLSVMVSIDIRTNRVELRPIGEEGQAQLEQITALANDQQGAAVVLEGIDGIRPAACSGTYQWCDAPLRGGVAIRSVSGVNCTAGFIVRSNSDDVPYVLTAGHCPQASGYSSNWQTKKPATAPALTTIGNRHNSEYGTATSSTLDTAIIDINDPTGWNPKPWVLVKASAMTSLNEQYSMSGVGSTAGLAQYSYLCTTGAASATRCGQYFASGVAGAGGVTNTAWVGFTTCDGDSGGPVYKNHLGYGIVHASIGTLTLTTLDTGLSSTYAGYCGTSSLYQGLAGAAAAMNVYLDT